MLSLPATKGFEIGSGFAGTRMRGSVHNDQFRKGSVVDGKQLLTTTSNNAGGTLGGITHGEPITFRVPIKPVSTIGQAQETVTFDGLPLTLTLTLTLTAGDSYLRWLIGHARGEREA